MTKKVIKNFWFEAVTENMKYTAISLYNLKSHCNRQAKVDQQDLLFEVYYSGRKRNAKIGEYSTSNHRLVYLNGFQKAMKWVEEENT